MNEINKLNLEELTPGQILNKVRVSKNLTESDVAQQLLLGKQTIIAIEKDDYSKIVAPVYARGYLRSYAQFLGINPDLIIENFNKLKIYAETQVFNEASPRQQIKDKNSFFKNMQVNWLLYGIFALVVFVLIIVIAGHSAVSNNETMNTSESNDAIPVGATIKSDATVKPSTDKLSNIELKKDNITKQNKLNFLEDQNATDDSNVSSSNSEIKSPVAKTNRDEPYSKQSGVSGRQRGASAKRSYVIHEDASIEPTTPGNLSAKSVDGE